MPKTIQNGQKTIVDSFFQTHWLISKIGNTLLRKFSNFEKKLVRLLIKLNLSMKNDSSEPEFEVGHVSRTRLILS
jgi:hypothetical protein